QDADKNQIETLTTTLDGKFSFTVGCEKKYTVLASKEKYTKDSKEIKTNKERLKINDGSMALKSEEAIKKEELIALEQKKLDLAINAKKEKDLAETKKKEKIAALLANEK